MRFTRHSEKQKMNDGSVGRNMAAAKQCSQISRSRIGLFDERWNGGRILSSNL